MFCPNCRAEYRPGFARCADCDVELVERVPEELSDDSPHEGNLMLLWRGADLALHEMLCEELKAAQIPYFNRPLGNYSMKAFPNRFPPPGTPPFAPFGFEVGVLSSDWERANVILERITRTLGG